jgi:hypothetical protein
LLKPVDFAEFSLEMVRLMVEDRKTVEQITTGAVRLRTNLAGQDAAADARPLV